MSEFRYNEAAHALEDDLIEVLSEASREDAVKAAQAETQKREQASGGLQRIAQGKTPLDEVKSIIEAKSLKTSSQEILEHEVRKEIRKIASRGKQLVDNFLTAAEGD